MTETETLRQAAALMRRERGANPFFCAVADWLVATAAEHETASSGNSTIDAFFAEFNTAPDHAALAAAREYLGETA